MSDYGGDNFDDCGPIHLTNVDWSNSDHKRTVAACLIQCVYAKEGDRHKVRTGNTGLARAWCEFFDFMYIKDLLDTCDGSVIGCVFEYQNPNNSNQESPENQPPKYVVALRGTLFDSAMIIRDALLDVKYFLNLKADDTRHRTSLKAVEDIIARVGVKHVWLAGHSLGASVALHVGKTLAARGIRIDTYLFNPPYCSIPFEKLSNLRLKTVFRTAMSALTIAYHVYSTSSDSSSSSSTATTMTRNNEMFAALRPWIPKLFVNHRDLICCEFIGHFEHQKTMESWGLGFLHKFVGQQSLVSLISSGRYGQESESFQMIPSALIIRNLNPMADDNPVTAHRIAQWWTAHSNFLSTRFEFDHISCTDAPPLRI